MPDPVSDLCELDRVLLPPLFVAKLGGKLLHTPVDLDLVRVFAATHSDTNKSYWWAGPKILVEKPEADGFDLFVCPDVPILLLLLSSGEKSGQLELKAYHSASKFLSLHSLCKLFG